MAATATVDTASWEALGTTALVRVGDPAALADARALVEGELDAIDRAASRFRPDSELERVNAGAGRFTEIGPLLYEAILVALRAAALTDGAVDPTLGEPIRRSGYVRDWRELPRARPRDPVGHAPVLARRSPGAGGWREVALSAAPIAVRLPAGLRLDLGATAKALAADRAARAVHDATGVGVLVALGGDVATAGPAPAEGWTIHVTDDHRGGPAAPGQTLRIGDGALATSSTTARRWRHDGVTMHHLLDPATGAPAHGPWRTASVAAASCVDANTASTAAIVLGASAPDWLAERGLPARLVALDGGVRAVAGWPAQAGA
jgi:thiamine biosynthesis lipoprotein